MGIQPVEQFLSVEFGNLGCQVMGFGARLSLPAPALPARRPVFLYNSLNKP